MSCDYPSDEPVSREPTASVVIAAHDEENVIGGLLGEFLADARPGEFDVYVVCNGCTDRTAEVAERHSGVTVLELAVASKCAALNAGDQAAGDVFPRIYLDADVTVDSATLRKVVQVLAGPAPRAAAPRLLVDTTGRPLVVRGFYHIFVRLPWTTENLIGSGFYGLSRAGRQRFASFPEILNEDQFVRHLFAKDERVAVADAHFTIQAPFSTVTLIRTKARVFRGLADADPDRTDSPGTQTPVPRGGSLPFLVLMTRPANWLPLAAYAYVRSAARVVAYTHRFRPNADEWSQDRTTRTARSLK